MGQTSNRLRTRIGQHLLALQRSQQLSSLTAHFNSECTLQHVRFFGVERALSSSTRLLKEAKWIKTLRTKTPCGLNDVAGTTVRKFNLVTRPALCTDRLNSVVRKLCKDSDIPFRCAFAADGSLSRFFS